MISTTPFLDRIHTPQDLKQLREEDLPALATEIRTEIIETVSQTGGHLGANLGVVELTVALHFVFHTPEDKLVWDVGHQAYPHKMLTGRRSLMPTLRQGGGLSGAQFHVHFCGAGDARGSDSATQKPRHRDCRHRGWRHECWHGL